MQAAGFLAASDEAIALLARAEGDDDVLAGLVARRLTGEPLAWITGSVRFCGLEVHVDPGVYVPRPHSEALAVRAAARLPTAGVAIDVCTGCGAVARVLAATSPGSRVVATDRDPRAIACALGNGVEAYRGDLFSPVPPELLGRVDVVVAVVPYVPTAALPLLARDTLRFESDLAYHGGVDGTRLLQRVVAESPAFLRAGGALVLELGGDQADLLAPALDAAGFGDVQRLVDDEGDVRGLEATAMGSLLSHA